MAGKITEQELESIYNNKITNLTRGINVKDHGLLGNNTNNDATQLNTLLTSIGTTKTDLYFPAGTYKISTNVVMGNNINLIMANGAVLRRTNSAIITLNCSIDAGLYQVFGDDGTGGLTGTINNAFAYCEWFKNTTDTYYNKSIQQLFNVCKKLILAERQYNVNDETIYLSPTAIQNAFEIEQRLGEGRGTGSLYCYGFTDPNKYLFKVNEDVNGTIVTEWPSTRLIIRNLVVWGWSATQPNFIWLNQSSIDIDNLGLFGFKSGIRGTGYTDQMRIRRIQWFPRTADDWFMYKDFYGDSMIIEQIFTGDYNAVYLKHTNGATINACNGGRYEIDSSQGVSMNNFHQEMGEARSSITIKNSAVVLNNFRNWNSEDKAQITIDDNLTNSYPSTVKINDCTFIRLSSPEGRIQGTIYINSLKKDSRILLNNNRILIQSFESVYQYTSIVMRCNNSFSSQLDGLLIDYHHYLDGNMVVMWDNGAWRVYDQCTKGILQTHGSAKPSIVAIDNTTTGYGDGTLDAGTYYYRADLTTGYQRRSPQSTEVSVVKSSNASTGVVKLTVTGKAGMMLRVRRGISTNTYTVETRLKMTNDVMIFYDIGASLSGMPYGSVSGAFSDSQGTGTGTYNQINNKLTIQEADSWLIQQIFFNKGDEFQRLISNTQEGYPKSYQFIDNSGYIFKMIEQYGIAKGTTENRPDISNGAVYTKAYCVGLQYLDTTLDADGKLIMWNGSAWVDSTGAVV